MQDRKCIQWLSAMSGPHFGWVNFTLIVFYRPWAAIFDDFYRFSVIFGPKMRFLGLEKQNPWVVLIWTLPQGPGPHCKLINFTFVGFCGPWVVIKYEIYQKNDSFWLFLAWKYSFKSYVKCTVIYKYRATYLLANYFFHSSLKYVLCLLLLHKSWFLLFPPIFAVFWAQKCMIRAPLARLHMGF